VRRAAATAVRRSRRGRDAVAWERAAEVELNHWRHVLAEDHEHVGWLTWAEAPIVAGSPLHRVLSELGVASPRVLDVGAGPITPLGRMFGGTQIDLVAVDPLADRYNALLDELGIVTPIRTVKAEGERLLELFAPDSFDVACVTNALDHCYDPVVVIGQMIEVVRPGGKVLTDHYTNEGERRLYRGMHLWNIQERDGHLVIWNPDRSVDVTQAHVRSADLRVERNGNRIIAVATKRLPVIGTKPWPPSAASARVVTED
jgi:SAM-dependent methyltransferase